jgi:hypothetical protein
VSSGVFRASGFNGVMSAVLFIFLYCGFLLLKESLFEGILPLSA